MQDIDPTLADADDAQAPVRDAPASADGSFSLSNILLSEAPGGRTTYVSFPYAAGAPELMRGLGGRWDKMASAWSVPTGKMPAVRQRLPRVAELVRVQQRIDAASGRASASAVSAPHLRSAGPSVPLPIVGDGWIELGRTEIPSEGDIIKTMGCAAIWGGYGLVWHAPDEETAARAREAMARVRAAAALAEAVKKDKAAAERERAPAERERLDDLRATVAATLGRGRYEDYDLDGLAEVAAVWPTAKFFMFSSHTLDDKGAYGVSVRTPSGRAISILSACRVEKTQKSRRVGLIEIRAPCFPREAGYVTTVTTTRNQKTSTDDMPGWKPPAVAAQPEAADIAAPVEPPPAVKPISSADVAAEVAPAALRAPDPAEPTPAPPAMTRESSAALRECLVVLHGRGDLGLAEVGFCRSVLTRTRLLPEMIPSCRKLVFRRRDRLSPELAAAALGEPLHVKETTAAATAPVEDAAPAAAPGVRRGRPPVGDAALTKAQRNKRWRESKGLVTVDMPAGLAARIRALRDVRGGTTGELLSAALDALERLEATG